MPVKRRDKNRQQLLFEFDMQRDSHESGQTKRDYFIGEPYPPSTKSLRELKGIGIADLQPEARAHGTTLFVRTIDSGVQAAGVHNIVEDENGAVERLVLYNSHATATAEQLLAKDMIFALKEPFCEITPTGNSCLRVDHPSDIVHLPSEDSFVPRAWRPQSNGGEVTALGWKTRGNDLYKSGNFNAALDAFTQGLKLCSLGDISVRHDLLRNRAIVYTYLKRFEHAIADAEAAVIPSEDSQNEQLKTLNSKAYFRAGRAAYELRNFRQAMEYYEKAQILTPTDKDTDKELRRVKERIEEQLTGNYDFELMAGSVNRKRNRLDHADFFSRVEVLDAGSHGNGLFATVDIAAGDLVLCEKALCVAFDSDRGLPDLTVLDSKSHRQLAGTQASVLFGLIGRLLHSSEQAAVFFKIYDAVYPYKTPTEFVDDVVPVDTFRVQAVVQHNAFGCPTTRTTSKEARRQSKSPSGYPSTGLWVTAAYTNHACNGNAMRSFIGDMIVMKATRGIPKGEEILMPYRLPNADNGVTQDELRNIWGFTCDCIVCMAERKTSRSQRQERMRLIGEISTLLSANPSSGQQHTKEKVVSQVAKRCERLETTYDGKAFDAVPRLGLVAPGIWLCQVYFSKGIWDNVTKVAVDVLRNLGYIVTFSEETLSVDRSHCHLISEAVDAAMFATRAFRSRDRSKLAVQMEAFAKELYMTLNGEMRGFDDQYTHV